MLDRLLAEIAPTRYVVTTGFLLFFLVCFVGVLIVKQAARERQFLAWAAGLGAVLFIAFLAVYVLDAVQLGGLRWIFWKYLDSHAAQYAVFSIATLASLGAGTLALLVTPQEREGLVLRRVGAFLATVLVAAAVLFFLFDVPMPGRL